MSDVVFTPEQQAEVDRIVGKRLARERVSEARVLSEPRKYSLDGPHSWYADVVARATNANTAPRATERLTEYERELGWHMAQGTKEGQRAERVLRALDRTPNADQHERRHTARIKELRAFGTDGGIEATSPGEAASLVSPYFLVDQWAPYHGAYRTFADQCHSLPMVSYGMHVYIPYMSTGAKATEQAEGGSVTETAPVGGLEGAEVKTITGQVIASQQWHDRGYTGGGSADVIIQEQIQQQLDERIDKYVLAQAIEKGKSVSGASTWAIEKFYEDLAKGREELTDTAGTRLRPTHMFTSSDFYSYVTRQVDTTNKRPIVVPMFAPGFPLVKGADDFDSRPLPKWARFTGQVMPGGVLWFTDENIPAFGTGEQIQIIVSAPEVAIVLLEDEPLLSVFVETLANTMRVVLNLRSYVAAITRHASGTAAIAGAAYYKGLV